MPPTRASKLASTSSSSKVSGLSSKSKSRKTSTLFDKVGENAAVGTKTGVVRPISKFLTPFPKPSPSPTPDSTPTPGIVKDAKGKGKDKQIESAGTDVGDGSLWVDLYEPRFEELAVHKKKVEHVRSWLEEALGQSTPFKKYRRILALTGPAGTGKTTTIKVLSKELDFDIVEWRNAMGERFTEDTEYESLASKFQTFLDRASSYQTLTLVPSTSPSTSSQNQTTVTRKQVILIEDLPNVLHSSTREAFHSALTAFTTSPDQPSCPIILIVSDSGIRGEAGDDDATGLNPGGWRGRSNIDAVDVRGVVPPNVFNSPYFTQIMFNPIAVTLLRKALNCLLDKHFSSSIGVNLTRPSKEVVDIVIDSANGDIRSAVMALQFACVVDMPKKGAKSRSKAGSKAASKSAKGILEAITRREQSLALFHLLGKILYSKRYGDPEEKEDAPFEPPKLPQHLREEHARRLSKVDTNVLYADSPVDTSLLSLYVHQNYTQYCNDVDECDNVMSWLSISDTIGEGDAWPLNASLIPHSFQLLTLGTLHSLPSPVPRRGQKNYKPNFFEALKKKREAEDGIVDVRAWLENAGVAEEEHKLGEGVGGWGGQWTPYSVVCEIGRVISLLGEQGGKGDLSLPPPSHSAFSRMQWDARDPSMLLKHADEDEPFERAEGGLAGMDLEEEEEERQARVKVIVLENKSEEEQQKLKEQQGWLSDDDIDEDFGGD